MVRGVALALTFLTGFSGLVYEVAWQKYLATLLGSHSEAAAAVLGIFLGGLSLGYSWFGAVTRRRLVTARAAGRPPRLLALYGVVELSIGVYVLLFPTLFRVAQWISVAVPHEAGGAGFAFDVLLTALLIGPPSTLMGGTIPILSQALARGLDDATRVHAFIYASNTAGAFAGALAAGFVLVPLLGLESCMRAMGAVNLAAGALFVLLSTRALERPEAAAQGAPVRIAGWTALAGVALLNGFAVMSLETVLIHLGGLAFGASQFTFSMVVAVFVLCIALGSLVVSALPRIRPGYLVASQWLLFTLLYLLYAELQNAGYWAHALRALFRDVDAAFYPYYLSAFACGLAVLALPVGLSGAALPLLFHLLRREVGDLGATAGRLYSWNTLGSLLGALLGGYALLFWLDLHHVYRLALAAFAIAAVMLSIRLLALPRLAVVAVVLLPVLGALALLPAWEPLRLSIGLFRSRQPLPQTFAGSTEYFARRGPQLVKFSDDDPTATIAVVETSQGFGTPVLSIMNNGKADGSIPFDYPTMALAALVPALFAEQAERAFVIGFGTGVTAGELGNLPTMQEVEVAEISPGVVAAAPWFDSHNQNASRNPKVRIFHGDAYRTLLRGEGEYDVIASEPSNPWVTGVEMLFSREFLEAARRRLRPGGVYCQWFHTYETDTEVIALVLRTYAEVFDHVAVWYALGPDLLLLGFDRPDRYGDLERLESRMREPAMAAGLARAGITSLPGLLAHELLPLDVLGAARLAGDVHTLAHPVLSHRAARAFFRGAQAELPPSFGGEAPRVAAERSLLQRLAARNGGHLADGERSQAVSETCRHRPGECLTLLSRWQLDAPESPELGRVRKEAQQNAAVQAVWKPGLLVLLGRLFDANGGAPGLPVTPTLAQSATEHFSHFYHHAAPFRREALAALWSRCRPDPGDAEGCTRGRAAAEARLGAL
jgi:spermidine synthase